VICGIPHQGDVAVDRLRTAATVAVVIAVLALAVVVSAARVMLSDSDGLHRRIEQQLSARLDMPVSIRRVEGGLSLLRPALELRGVRGDGPGIEFRIRELTLIVDPLASLLAASPRLALLAADGVRVSIVGRLPETSPDNAGASPPLAGLLRELHGLPFPAHASIRDGRLSWKPEAGARARVFDDIALSLEPGAAGARLEARLRPPETIAERVRMALELDDAGLRGYLQARDLDVAGAGVFAAALGRPLPRSGAGSVDGEAWFRLGQEGIVTASARFEGSGLTLRRGAVLDRLAGVVQWRRQPDGWRADLALDAVVPAGGKPWPRLRAGLVRHEQSWRLGLEGVDLGQALALARPHLPPSWRSRLAAHNPDGLLTAFGMAWTGDFEIDGRWRARGELRDFEMAAEPGPDGRLPGVSAVDLAFEADPRGGRFDLSGRDGALALPWLFRTPLPFQRVTAAGEWYVDPADGRVLVQASELEVHSADGHGRARVAVWAGAGRTPFLDIRAHLENARAARISRYLPTAIMPPKLVAWLDGAIVDGRVTEADLLLFGPADAFPFREGGGVFDLRARVRDARFAYFPGWPALEDVVGELHFHNESMTITGSDGHIHGVRLLEARARIDNLKSPALTVDGRFSGPGDDLLRFLVEAPVADAGEEILRELSLGGEHELTLSLGVPFHHRPITLEGALTLEAAVLGIPALGYRITDLGGVIRFDRDGMSWDGLQGRFGGAPLLSKAVTVGEGEAARIRSNTRFRAGAEDLFPDSELAARFAGQAEWLLTVEASGFRGGPFEARVLLDSDLQGLAVQAPPPFGKRAEPARSFSLSGRIAPPERLPWRLQYGDGVSALVELNRERTAAVRMGLHFGSGEPGFPDGGGLRVSGRLAELPDLPLPGGEGAVPGTSPLPPLTELDLTIERIALADYQVAPLTVAGNRGDDGWRLRLGGAAAGEAHWRPDDNRLELRLQRLQLAPVEPMPGGANASDAPAEAVPPPRLPALRVDIADLRLGARALGSLALAFDATDTGMRLQRLRLENPDGVVTLQGHWRREVNRSHLEGRVETGDAGSLLQRFGAGPVLEQGRGEASANLSWDGPLRAPEMASLDGELGFDLRDGVLPAVDPGAGRLVGLLSLSLVPRRLALDFSDVTQEGLHFDRLHARFLLQDGIARPEFFTLASPAARIEVTGPIDLAERTYDQVVTVTPRVSRTLPLLGALAAGPQVALALFLAEQLLGAGVDGLTQFQYRIEGSWDSPTFSPVAPAPAPKGSEITPR
jgi:uncharacterized protein (TIGR02099 family)